MVKFKITSLDGLPVGMQALVVKDPTDNSFYIDIPDPVDPNKLLEKDPKLDEFRNNNIELKKQLDALNAKFGGIDMNAYEAGQKALENLQSDEDRKLMLAGRFDDVIARATSKLTEKYEADLLKITGDLTTERESTGKIKGQLKRARIATDLNEAAARLKMQIIPTALADIHNRAYSAMDLDESGNVVGLDAEGNVRMNVDRKTYGSGDFLKEMLETAPHLLVGANMPNPGSPGRRGPGGAMTLDVDLSDPRSFGNNLEAIASGKVDVRGS